MVSRLIWDKEIAGSNPVYPSPKFFLIIFIFNLFIIFKRRLVSWQSGYCGVLLILFSEVQFLLIPTNVLKFGKQSPLKQEWKKFLKSSSLFVRNLVSKIVFLNLFIFFILFYLIKKE